MTKKDGKSPTRDKNEKKEWNKKEWNIVTKRNAMTKERQARQHAHHQHKTDMQNNQEEMGKDQMLQHKTTNK